ncbi:MAG: hypothetical protein KDD11_19870 [Acidobacteria bacterium]|nr:hypothetical protein [Acidobacteriota bacterium]
MSQRRRSLRPRAWSPGSALRVPLLAACLTLSATAGWAQLSLTRPPLVSAPGPQDLTSAVDAAFTRALPWRFLGPAGEADAELDHLAVSDGAQPTLFATRLAGAPFRLSLDAAGPFDGGIDEFVSVPRATSLIPDPRRPQVVYATAGDGTLLRYDGSTGQTRQISVWPRPRGFDTGAAPLYRFAPAFPVFFSAHDADALYAAGNLLFTSTDAGQTWAAVSPDLTRPRRGGGRGDGVLVAAFESRVEAGVFWTASDTGVVHLSRDFAATWLDVTPPQLPAGARITALVPHPQAPGYVYLAAVDPDGADSATTPPWVFRSQDYGATWTALTRGLPASTRVRTLVVDPERAGLLFAATDDGLFLTLDDGSRWRRWPPADAVPPIRDLVFAGRSLVAAVEGGGLWVQDDLAPLRQLSSEALTQDFYLFSPTRAVRRGAQDPRRAAVGADPETDGVAIFYRLGSLPAGTEVQLQLLGPGGVKIRSYTTAVGVVAGSRRPPARPGLNRFDWDLRYPPAEGSSEPGQRGLWRGGPRVLPGSYLVRLAVGSDSTTAQFRVDRDPRVSASPEALQAQFDFLLRVRDEIGHVYRVRRDIERLARLLARAPAETGLDVGSAPAGARATAALRNLRQSLQGLDLLLGPTALAGPDEARSGGLAEQLSELAASVELALDRPTASQAAVLEELVAEVEAAADTFQRLETIDLAALNELRREQGLPALLLPATVEPAPDAEAEEAEEPAEAVEPADSTTDPELDALPPAAIDDPAGSVAAAPQGPADTIDAVPDSPADAPAPPVDPSSDPPQDPTDDLEHAP